MTLTHDGPVTEPARFRPQGQDDLAPSGAASRVVANLAALRALRVLQAEGRPATPDEQAVLARWSGWGAVPQVFDDDRDEFAAARAELHQLLPEPDYAAARRTTINAHYTDAALARVVWDAVAALGFDGGQVLEPGCGSGNFIGLAPPGAQVLGVELDPVTAGIAARLYPDAEIRCESFADTRLPEGQFDLVIGNVPFSPAKLHDRRHNAAGHSMHNHFIIKSLKFLKPGGLLAVLTSRYTMDAQDPSAREEMAELASLVTAVRLPSGAHRRAAGTEAVTDLLILRRSEPGTFGVRPQWRRAFETSLDGGTTWINEYWRDHPENVLGSFTVGRSQYNDHDLTVRPSGDLSGVASQLAVRLAARPVTVALQAVPAGETDRFEGTLRANGDGSFSVLRDGLWQSWPCPVTQAGELRDLLGLRDTVAALLDAEASSPADTPAIAGLRAELNRRYDGYAAAYGPVNRMWWKRTGRTDNEGNDLLARQRPPQGKFSEDPYAAAVYALEDFDPETGTAAKTVIFTKRVITTRQPPESASSPADAVAICVDSAGEVRLEDAARLLGSASAKETRASLGELVYDEPGTGRLVPAAEYLSGKVRAKLRDAGQAAGDDPRFEVNVAALRRALPPDLGPGEIDGRLGASWIDPRYVQQGLREILEDPALTVEKGHGTAWTVTGSKTSVLATQVWGTEDKDAVSLAACLLEQRPVKVSPSRSDRDESAREKHQKRLQAAAATVTARAKADELNRRFGEWLWEDPERTADLVQTYNERFNSLVPRSYDGARPTLPGLASWFREWVHPHQLAAVARIINEPAVLLAHDVGAGKTAEMAMGAMELRRLGLAAKPAIVVPNHMLEQFQREFLQLYPQARVLAAGNDDLKTHGRNTFVARIATGNWDAVIMSQSVFERIPMSAPEIERYINAQLADYTAWLERAREAKRSKRMIKKMETRMLMREQRLRKKLDRARDGGICWEQTGIDYLFIDEAHDHKNLDTRSNNSELDIDGSGRASDLEMKLDYLRTTHGRRVVTFATATPIANSMTEAYVMCRYLRPDLLADAGIEDFDAWVGTFAETTTDVEVAPEGGIRVKDRFARFRNIPELLDMWRVAADVKTKEDLKLPVPGLAGGKPEVIPVEPSQQLLDFMGTLASRAEDVRRHAFLPEEDNMLKISNDGRLAALDPRLAGLGTPETGKLDVAAQNIARIEHEHRDDTYYDADGNLLPVKGSLQIVFCDLGTPGGKSRWNAYEYLRGKLAEYGVDPRKVRFMHDARTDKAKAELFAAARAGKVAVLMGSTKLMGVGMNVQDIAIALHHLDCPWRPADVAQREGRILRQRNKHPQVQIYRYVTERSFDAYMWQTVTRKAKFIDQVIHGKTTGRDAEDIGGDVQSLSYSEVTALATGDMRILAKAKADSEVQRLERLESAWRRTQQHLKTKISDSAQSVTRLTDVTARLGAAIARRTDTRGDAFTMRLDGQAFSKRTDAATCLRSTLRTQISQARRGNRPRDAREDIGVLGGFTIICTPTWGSGNQVWAHLRFDGVPVPAVRISETELDLAPDKPPVGLITRLENKLADLGTDRDKVLQEISRIQAETERARTAVSAPFAYAAELSRARVRSDRLAEELSGEPSAPPPAPAAGETPDAGEASPDPAATTDGDPGQHASPASPSADDPDTHVGGTGDLARTSRAPGSGAQPAAEEAEPAQKAQASATSRPAPPGPAQPAAPARQPAAASPPMPAPAPAGTSSRADQAAVTEAAPAPSAAGPGHPANQDQPAASDPAGATTGGLVIEHHQQGTLVHGTQKNDHQLRRVLHNHGFRWSGNLNAWYLPRPWTFSTRARRVASLTADLRQAHRSFTMRSQPPAPGDTDDSPPEPLPAADPYTDLRQARGDHFEAVSDYWALTRTPAGNNVMSTYPESGARPDALALNAAYKAVHVSWDEAFAGDPDEVAGRFTAWVQAASAVSRNLASERHRAPAFRQTLDTFIGSAARLASRTQATARDPAAWAHVFADISGSVPASRTAPEQAASPDPALPAAGSPGPGTVPPQDEPAHQGSDERGYTPGIGPRAAATPETGARPDPGEPAGSAGQKPGASPLTNNDLAAGLRRLPGFARWLSQPGIPPTGGDADSQHPDAGPAAVCDARGIEITVSGPGWTRHGLVTWPQAASWIDAGVTPARLGIVIIADRLSVFCRSHRDQLSAAGTCDPDAAAAELGQIRDNAIAMVVDAALRSRGAAAPVPPPSPGDPAWYMAVMITRPDRAAGKAENAALERLTRLRTMIREPQPATAAEVRATIRRWTGYGLPDVVRALDDPAAMRTWISEQASRPVPGSYDGSGGRWYGACPDGLITDRSGDDRAATLIRWEEIPAWIQPGITSSLCDRLLAAADASSAVFRRMFTAAAHPDAGLTAPSEEKDKQAARQRRAAVDAAWAAIEAAPPPSSAELNHARHVYRDTSPVQQALFDDPPQDSMQAQDGARPTASRPPRPAASGPAASAGVGRPAAKAAAPQAAPAHPQDPPGHRAAVPRHSPAPGPAVPAGEHYQEADRPGPRTGPEEDQPAVPLPDVASPRAAGTRRQNSGTAAGPAHAVPAHDDDPEPRQTPAINSDLAIALHHMSGQDFTSFLTMGETPRHGSRGWRRDGLPDAGASEDLDFEPSGVRITVRSRGFRRHGQISWQQVASWIDAGLTPARLGIITAASRLHIYTYARRDQMIAAGKNNIDAAIRELNQISTDAVDTALGAALGARDADAPVPPARPVKPAYRTTAMLTRPDPSATPEENTALARIAELEAAIRGAQLVTPADIRDAIRWWIGDSLPEYARALASPEAMRAWIRRQASGPASRPGKGTYDSATGRYYSASPEGLRTSKGSDSRTPSFILWEEIPAWIQPGLSASLRDRLAAAEPRQAPGRKRAAAASPPAHSADPAGQADDPLPRPLREAIDATWAAIETAPPPSPAELDHAWTVYRDTGTAREPMPGSPAKTGQIVTPAPPPRAEPRPGALPRRPAPAAHRQDELPGAAAASAPAGSPPQHDVPARAAASAGARPGRGPEPAALLQPASTPVLLTDDDIFLAISRLPAFVIGDLFSAIDNGQPLESACRQLAPYSGERAAGEPDPGARETVTAEPAGLRIEVAPGDSRRTGLITWPQIDGLLGPGLTPARRQIVVQASQIRMRFAAANASFRAVGEGRLAAAAEDELRARAVAAVTAILTAARPAGGGQAPQPADEAATIERIAELAAALPSQPPQPRTPAGQVTTGAIIGHPGYRFQPFRVAAPPRHTDAAIEITGCLTDPSAGEPAGQITLTLTRAGHPDPVVYLVPPPARSLRSFPGGTTTTEGHTDQDHTRADDDSPSDIAQPAARHRQPPATASRPHADLAGTPATGSTATPGMTPGTATPGPSRVNGTGQPPDTTPLIQEETMPPAISGTSLPPEGTAPADQPAGPAPAAWKLVARSAPASQVRPGSQSADDTRLLHELDHVLAAITERRRAAAAPPGTDGTSFADIRAAFTVLRHALDLPGPASNGDGARQGAAVPDAGQPASPPPGAAQDGAAAAHGDFSDIRAAFASLRDVLGLPAPDGHHLPAAPGPDVHAGPDAGRLLDQAAAEAHACAWWYRDTPEWQRMSRIGRAARELLTAIREAAGDYWAEIRLDIRVRGFARTLAARVSLAVSGASHLLAGRLERAGHRDTRPWRAAWRLHQAAATFANRVMNYTPPGSPARMDDARRIIDDLDHGAQRRGGLEPSRAASPPGRDTRTPGAVSLGRECFPVLVSRANTRPGAAPAARTPAPPPPHQAPAAARR